MPHSWGDCSVHPLAVQVHALFMVAFPVRVKEGLQLCQYRAVHLLLRCYALANNPDACIHVVQSYLPELLIRVGRLGNRLLWSL